MELNLKKSVATLEDNIIVMSGPALAISGIIAGVDLLTGGHVLQQYPGLTLAWAICLLLTLDFQVLCLGVRAHRSYASQAAWQKKAAEIILAVIVAAGISFVSIQMQSIIARVNAENISIDSAAAQLGINTVSLIWERSTLVLVLIFMSGWLREHDGAKSAQLAVATVQQAPSITTEQVDLILARLARLDAIEQHLATGPAAAVQVVQAQEQALPTAQPLQLQAPENDLENLNQIDGHARLGIIEQAMLDAIQKATPEEQAELRTLADAQTPTEFTRTLQQRYPDYANYITEARVIRVLAVFQAGEQRTAPKAEQENSPANLNQISDKNEPAPIYPAKFESAETRVAAALAANPGATIEQIAAAAGCSERTAAKWLERLAQGQQAGK